MRTRGKASTIVVGASSIAVVGAFAVSIFVWQVGAVTGSRKASSQDPSEWAAAKPPSPTWSATAFMDADPLSDLRDRELRLPLEGATREALRDSFHETRGSTHLHEAIDMLAPRNTPVLAVENGAIARLFYSNAGGNTVYQFDPMVRYAYYYAHLERYADGLHEGEQVHGGQVLGYVGTSGNAPKDTPHLHFAIFVLTAKRQWWHGNPIDPYEVFR